MGKKILFLFFYLTINIAYSKVYDFKNYSLDQGLPQSQVFSLFQSYDHSVWVGTNGGGLSSFDGKYFVKYASKNGLYGITVMSVLQADPSNLWIGTDIGLFHYDGVSFTDFESLGDTPNGGVNALLKLQDGTIVIGGENGLTFFKDDRFYSLKGLEGVGVVDFAFEKGQGFYAQLYDIGLVYIRKDEVVLLKDKIVQNWNNITSIDYSKEIGLIIAGYDGAFNLGYTNEWKSRKIEFNQTISTINEVIIASDQSIWFGSESGAIQIKEGKQLYLDATSGMLNDLVWCIMEDHQGNIWLGTDAGISIFTKSPFEMLNAFDGLSVDYTWAVEKTSDGILWIGTENGLNYIENGEVKEYAPSIFYESTILCLKEDSQKRLWIGTDRFGFFCLENNKLKKFSSNGFGFTRADVFFEDGEGTMWVSSYGEGLYQYKENELHSIGKELGVSNFEIVDIFQTDNGEVWLATYNKGIFVSKDRLTFEKVVYKEKNLALICSEKYLDGYFLFTYGQGIYFLTPNAGVLSSITELDVNNEMIEQGILSSTMHQGDIWAGTNSGIYQIDPARLFNNEEKAFHFYSKSSGFLGLECNQSSLFSDGELLYTGSFKGLVVYDYKKQPNSNDFPSVRLTKILLRENVIGSLKSEFTHDNNEFTFSFVGIDYRNSAAVNYKYKLEGFDKNWSTPSSIDEVRYGNLPPGTYTFKVMARGGRSDWNPEPATYSFNIQPPFYRTYWFYLLSGLILLIMIVFIIKSREKRLIATKKELEIKVDERTQELRNKNNQLEMAKALIEDKNLEITDSIKYAKRIQIAVMSDQEKFNKEVDNGFVILKPKDLVSGDFFWFNKKDNELLLACCDCTGHGVPGGFMSMMGNDFINQIVHDNQLVSPAKILYALNNKIIEALGKSKEFGVGIDGMDASIIKVNMESKMLDYSTALRPIMIVRNKEVITLKGDKFPIGGIAPLDYKYDLHQYQLLEGDQIYVFTDGYVDQFGGPKGKKFKIKQFRDLIIKISDKNKQEVRSTLETEFESWKGDLEQVDDVLVIGIQV